MYAGAQLNALDPTALGDLKRHAREGNSPEALRAAAKQFEALFLQMVLKSMREAMPSTGGLFDSDQTRLLQAMQDQQMALDMAQGSGFGLADVIFRQLGGVTEEAGRGQALDADGRPIFDVASIPRRAAVPAARQVEAEISATLAGGVENPAAAASAVDAAAGLAARIGAAIGAAPDAAAVRALPEGARAFVERVWPHAVEASRATGIPAHFMVAQAALETGWGRAELRRGDGAPGHNLFNIKAGRNWKGPVIELPVTEYANGRPYTENARFRAYGSYAEAFRDYANLLRNSPRYAAVLGQKDAAGFARSLQEAGFATDPLYADKLTRIIGGSTLRAALAG